MYKNVLNQNTFAIFLITLLLYSTKVSAQLSLTGQLRPRAELREGYGTLKPQINQNAAFVSQRSRLTFNYKWSRLIFQTSLQDVRLWGQDASTISAADGNKLSLHEAWAEIILSNKKDSSFKNSPVDYFAIKAGRQELVYDDERLLGNADWLQQARRHDAVVLKLLDKGWQLDMGGAFNQTSDAINYNGTYYLPANVPATVKDSKGSLVNTPAGIIPLLNATGVSTRNGSPAFVNPPGSNALNQNYKSLKYLYVAKKFSKTKFSGLFLTDQFGKYILDSVKSSPAADAGYVYGRRFNQQGTNTRFTAGFLLNPVFGSKNQVSLTGGYYYQGGHDKDGLSLSASMFTASVTYKPSELGFTAGWDYLSGNDAFSTPATNHRFDPLYGTPHKFWGYMDYFYAVSGAPTGGLSNPYLKVKYISADKRFSADLANHYFYLANKQKDAGGSVVSKYLGTEFDLTTNYLLNKFTSVDVGFSTMAATSSMEYAKNIAPGTASLHPVWAYLQLNIKPDFFSK